MKKLFQRLSLGKKIFAGTLFVFLLSFVLLLLGQLVFFNHYYTYLVRRNLQNSVSALASEYLSWETHAEINAGIVRRSNESNSYMMILGENGEIRHLVSYEMTVETPDKKQYRITLDNATKSKPFQEMNLKEGMTVSVQVKGHRDFRESNFYVPFQIDSADKHWTDSSDFRGIPPEIAEKFENHVISGTIVSILLPDEKSLGMYLPRNETFRAAMHWRQKRLSQELEEEAGTYHYLYTDFESGNPYMIVFTNIEKNGRAESILAISPMRSVVEAVTVAGRMSALWGLFAICVAGIIGFIFSKIFARPILRMSAVTKKMRELDFSELCEVRSQDEIGMLAQNINEMSDQLAKTISQLMSANEQLTADIEHERLLEQQRKEFVANVSHELKTPLAIIRAYTEALSDGISKEKQEHYLSVIVEETKRMNDLVLDMLKNAKLESGAERLDCSLQSLCETARKIVRRFENTLQQDDIRLTYTIPDSDQLYYFDRHWLNQVITNFLTNAISHTASGGEIRVLVKGGRLSVENTGTQIPEQELERVWERFYRTDQSRNRLSGGTGLGLAIAKNILNLHHAKYGVENTTDGVRFWFELPEKDN
ncbi:MAG: cell wall metabolism sensor histidine kinase WalK [Ruminococcaceae bacterium]|nr:cell wall metabolism sensor histidine kinase WalK [Oscillospiraceae bacterium]